MWRAARCDCFAAVMKIPSALTCVALLFTIAAGPALAAVLLHAFPTMEGFWVIAGAMMLIPIVIMLLFKPYETRTRTLEEIAQRR